MSRKIEQGVSFGQVDLFSTIDTVTTRYNNPRLRTSFSEQAHILVPKLLKENEELLKMTMGTKDVSVRIYGSCGVGVANTKSDIDLFIISGEKDGYNTKYEEEFGKEDRENYTEDDLEEIRLERFFEKALNLRKDERPHLDGKKLHALLAQIPGFLLDLSNIDFWTSYKTAFIFSCPPVFETTPGIDAKFRNSILFQILDSYRNEHLWEDIRGMFYRYFVNYEDSSVRKENADSQRQKVEEAFEAIFETQNVDPLRRVKAAEFLRGKRREIQLPTFEQLTTIESRISRLGFRGELFYRDDDWYQEDRKQERDWGI